MKFRKDINGLRAFAVIGVLLFHFNASWMPGGFAGVDVFFVISGFLMTGIIFRGIEQENFSILNFYVARANRIIPALALLCLVLLVFGWFYLMPIEYKVLAKHAASSIGFLSNFIYWREAGYFDAASHEKWLLHTWTLSVEWQFYIIYPLVLVAMRKFLSIKAMKSILIMGTVLGFIFSVIATYKLPNSSYYLLPMRAWEMMIGGVAYLYPFTLQENRKKLLERVGLVLVVGSYFLISAENAWPGYLASFPVIGSFLIIQAQRNDSIMTSNIVFQKIGTWSYSIYLWHWPLVVIIYTFKLPEYYIYLGMALSILLGFLSYKYVEKIKFPRSFPNILSYLKCKPIYIAGIVGVLCSVIFATNGANGWFKMQDAITKKTYFVIENSNAESKGWNAGVGGRQDFSECRFNTQDLTLEVKNRIKNCEKSYGPGYLILGDSHAEDLFGMVTYKFNDKFIVGLTSTKQCRPHTPNKQCQYMDVEKFVAENNKVFKHIIYEQAGFYLLLEGVEKGSRQMYADLDLSETVQDINVDKAHIQKVSEYLGKLSNYTSVTWFGSRAEPHITNKQLLNKGCNYKYKLRENQLESFYLLDKELESTLQAKTNLKFLSQNKVMNFDFSKDLINCDYKLWDDGDHLSKKGEEVLSGRLPNDFLVF